MDQHPTFNFDSGEPPQPRNILPLDGEAIDYGVVFGREEVGSLLNYLLREIPWQHDEAIMFGKHIVTARRVAWFGDRSYDYTYSGRTRTAMIWTPELLEIKQVVEEISGGSYNSCLLNLYDDGSQGMGWHSDDEKELGRNSTIASVSFGAARRFDFRHKITREKVSLILEPGSLLVMGGSTQQNWQHQIPKTAKVTMPRVNLTFRMMVGDKPQTGDQGKSGTIR